MELLTNWTTGSRSTSPGRWGPEALRRAFTQENLRWLCRECHRRKTRFDWRLAWSIRACSMDWRAAIRAWEINRVWAAEFLGIWPKSGYVRVYT